MSLNASGEYDRNIELAGVMIEMASHEKGEQKQIHMKQADELLTEIWNSLKHTDSATLGKNFNIKALKAKLSLVAEEVTKYSESNLKKPIESYTSIQGSSPSEVFSPAPADSEIASLYEDYHRLFNSYKRGETVLNEDIENLRSQDLPKDLKEKVVDLLNLVNLQIPSRLDKDDIKNQTLDVIANSLIKLMRNQQVNKTQLSVGVNKQLDLAIDFYKKAFKEKAKEAKTPQDEFTVLETSLFYLEPKNYKLSMEYGNRCADYLVDGNPMLYRLGLDDKKFLKLEPSLKWTFQGAFADQLKRRILSAPNGSIEREQLLEKIFDSKENWHYYAGTADGKTGLQKTDKWMNLSLAERQALVDFWKKVEPLPPNAAEVVVRMRKQTQEIVPK